MMAQAHMVAGATSWAVYSFYVTPALYSTWEQTVVYMGACSFAALLPDIDHPSSTLGQRIYPISKLISMVFGHRGFTHSLLALLGVIYVLSIIAPSHESSIWITVVSVGYLSHLVGDVITPAGLPLLYPMKRRFTTPWTIEAGGFGEKVVVIFYALFALALYTQWHMLIINAVSAWLQ